MARNNSINNESIGLTIDPGASGDSFVQYDINAVNKFRIGVDDSDSDSFKASVGSALGTNDSLVVTSSGEVKKPLQPSFLAVLDSTISDVTGDGTTYTIVWDTEVFDQGSNFDGTSTFTAPVTGRYMFAASILLGDIGASHNIYVFEIETSNRTYSVGQPSVGIARDSSSQYAYCVTAFADMDASDTAVVKIDVANSTKVIDVSSDGSTDPNNWFSGYLVC